MLDVLDIKLSIDKYVIENQILVGLHIQQLYIFLLHFFFPPGDQIGRIYLQSNFRNQILKRI